ncbi:MAG: THUMP domain-containing protein [Promethearchaeota archaeon]
MTEYTLLDSYNLILIRYNEIWLKSRKVQMRMLNTLVKNIRILLQRNDIPIHKYQLSKDATRIFFFVRNEDIEESVRIIRNVFGIHSISPAIRTSNQLKNIIGKAVEVGEKILNSRDTFAIRVKRSGKHNFSSKDIAEQAGSAVLEHFRDLNLKVNLSAPKKRIFIEVRGDFSYLYTDVLKSNWGGLPIEQQKKILVMDVGRLEDLLAGFLLMRRGSVIYPILFSLTEDKDALAFNLNNWREVADYFPGFQFFIRYINLVPIIKKILQSIDSKEYICALCRILRFKVISKLFETIQIEAFQSIRAITDGVSLNNRTDCKDDIDLESIALSRVFFPHPVFTPIIASESNDIDKEIYLLSKKLIKYNYCQFSPKNQLFDANILKDLMLTLDLDKLIQEAIENLEELNLLKREK